MLLVAPAAGDIILTPAGRRSRLWLTLTGRAATIRQGKIEAIFLREVRGSRRWIAVLVRWTDRTVTVIEKAYLTESRRGSVPFLVVRKKPWVLATQRSWWRRAMEWLDFVPWTAPRRETETETP